MSPGQTFSASFVTTALSTAGPHDLFVLTSTAASRVALLDIEIGSLSTAPGVVQSLGLRLWRGSTAPGGGAAIGPVNLNGWNAPAAVSGVTQNSSSVISTTSAVLLHAAALDAAGGNWCYKPACPPILNNSPAGQRAHLNITAPNVAVTLHGTLTFAEIGKMPVS